MRIRIVVNLLREIFYFLTQHSGLDFSLTSLWAIGSSFHGGHSTLKVIDLYSSIHSNSLSHWGPRIYRLSLSGNKNWLSRLPRSKLLFPIQETPTCVYLFMISFSISSSLWVCTFFLYSLYSLVFYCSTDIRTKQDSYFLSHL